MAAYRLSAQRAFLVHADAERRTYGRGYLFGRCQQQVAEVLSSCEGLTAPERALLASMCIVVEAQLAATGSDMRDVRGLCITSRIFGLDALRCIDVVHEYHHHQK